jgi:hypothetical protein
MWQARWRARLAEAHGGGPIEVACKVCGRPLSAKRRDLRRGVGQLCGEVCRAEARRLANLRRWRAGSEYDQVVSRLKAPPAHVFDGLAERDRELVRLYYGRQEGSPRPQAELAERCGVSPARVGELIRLAVARLLGPGIVPAAIDT